MKELANSQWSEWRRADAVWRIERDGPPPSLTFIVMQNRFQFLGEAIPELAALPPHARRRVYWKTAILAYRDWRTWLGIAVFAASLFAAWWLQLSPMVFFVVLVVGAWFSLRMHFWSMRRHIKDIQPHA